MKNASVNSRASTILECQKRAFHPTGAPAAIVPFGAVVRFVFLYFRSISRAIALIFHFLRTSESTQTRESVTQFVTFSQITRHEYPLNRALASFSSLASRVSGPREEIGRKCRRNRRRRAVAADTNRERFHGRAELDRRTGSMADPPSALFPSPSFIPTYPLPSSLSLCLFVSLFFSFSNLRLHSALNDVEFFFQIDI